MRKNYKARVLAGAALLLTGCAEPLPADVMQTADFGPRPQNYQAIAKKDINQSLIDPTSPLYTFTLGPFKQAMGGNSFTGATPKAGWAVCGTVNSKNRMGGYSGPSPFHVLIYKGQVVEEMVGDALDPDSVTNSIIADHCH